MPTKIRYNGTEIATVAAGETKILECSGKKMRSNVAVEVESGGEDVVLQSKSVTPTEATQEVTADEGYTALEKVTVAPIPDEYIVPSGDLAITENGTFDVTQYASAEVNVPIPQLVAPTLSIADDFITITDTSNGTFATSYDLYIDGSLVGNYTVTTIDLIRFVLAVGTHSITAVAKGTNFIDSAESEAVIYEAVDIDYGAELNGLWSLRPKDLDTSMITKEHMANIAFYSLVPAINNYAPCGVGHFDSFDTWTTGNKFDELELTLNDELFFSFNGIYPIITDNSGAFVYSDETNNRWDKYATFLIYGERTDDYSSGIPIQANILSFLKTNGIKKPITDIAGTYIFNDTIVPLDDRYRKNPSLSPTTIKIAVNYSCADAIYDDLTTISMGKIATKYSDLRFINSTSSTTTTAYSVRLNGWQDESYKTIEVTSTLDDLIAANGEELAYRFYFWLTANATKQ